MCVYMCICANVCLSELVCLHAFMCACVYAYKPHMHFNIYQCYNSILCPLFTDRKASTDDDAKTPQVEILTSEMPEVQIAYSN